MRGALWQLSVLYAPAWQSIRNIRGLQGARIVRNHSMLVDTSDFETLRQANQAYDEQREHVIKQSRDIQKLSKQAIFSLHRGDLQQAAARLQQAEATARTLLPIIEADSGLRYGSYSSAIEEYAEAIIFQHFLEHKRLLPSTQLSIASRDEYLGGVLDFTGELNRWAVARATQRDAQAVQLCRDLVDAVIGELLQFDLRNGAIRKKYDGIKYTLKKLENTLYELSLLQGGVRAAVDDAPPPGEDGVAVDDV